MEKEFLNTIMTSTAEDALERILEYVWEVFSSPVSLSKADSLIIERDRKIGELDTLVSGAAWNLWDEVFGSSLRTSQQLMKFWDQETEGKAILILDALSMREACWILEQADLRGYEIPSAKATFAEIPGNTSTFAKAIGFGQRSLLYDNHGCSLAFPGSFTESVDLPFSDCENLIKPEKNIFFWHHWPDSEIHDLADDGNSGRKLIKVAAETLISDDFWSFLGRLATGRRLIITGDHGYANSGLFRDLNDNDQINYMKSHLKSGRFEQGIEFGTHKWIPPLTMMIGKSTVALGRRKWRSQGGYPTLTHGGLSLLEMTVPFIELMKK